MSAILADPQLRCAQVQTTFPMNSRAQILYASLPHPPCRPADIERLSAILADPRPLEAKQNEVLMASRTPANFH